MHAPKSSQRGDGAAQAVGVQRVMDLDTLVARDTLGRVRQALDGFGEDDLRAAAEIIWDEMKSRLSKPISSVKANELRAFLLSTAEHLDSESLVRIAERLRRIGSSRLGKVSL